MISWWGLSLFITVPLKMSFLLQNDAVDVIMFIVVLIFLTDKIQSLKYLKIANIYICSSSIF